MCMVIFMEYAEICILIHLYICNFKLHIWRHIRYVFPDMQLYMNIYTLI